MKKTKRTEITVDMEQVFVLARPGGTYLAWCPECAEPVFLVSSEEAMLLAGLTSREIHRRVEAGRVHFAETPEGSLLVCPDSLLPAERFEA